MKNIQETFTVASCGADALRTPYIQNANRNGQDFAEIFERDVAKHVMEIFRDDGVNRHIRFRRPGTMCMHFDLLTWPGYLCYTGDMGTYVFSRLTDMFEFSVPLSVAPATKDEAP